MSTSSGGPESNLDAILAAVGRVSTPKVPTNPFGLTRGALLGVPDTHAGVTAVVVGGQDLVRRVAAVTPAVQAVPGALPEQVDVPSVTTLVIDWEAFRAGPWLGANTHAAAGLKEEIFEAGRRMRATGRLVLGLPVRPLVATGDARLLSTCTQDLTRIPDVDLEEGAPSSPLWEVLTDTLRQRSHRPATAPLEVR